MSLKSKLLIGLSVMALFGVVFLYALEFQWFQNYFNPKKLILGALLSGLAVGLLLGFNFQKRADELVEKMQIWSFCLIVPILLMPLLASLVNRLFAEQPKPLKVQFWEEKAYVMNRYGQLKGQKPDISGYYVFVINDGEMLRMESDKPVFPNAIQGDTVEIKVREGAFRVSFVAW